MVEIGAAARGGVADEVEVGRLKKNGGILVLFGEAASFLVRDNEGFLVAIIGGDDGFAISVGKFDAVEISIAFFDVGVSGTKRFAAC